MAYLPTFWLDFYGKCREIHHTWMVYQAYIRREEPRPTLNSSIATAESGDHGSQFDAKRLGKVQRCHTPPKTNMEPENDGFYLIGISSSRGSFSGSMFVLGGVIFKDSLHGPLLGGWIPT